MPTYGPIKCYFCGVKGLGHLTTYLQSEVPIYDIEIHQVNFPACPDCIVKIRASEVQRFIDIVKDRNEIS